MIICKQKYLVKSILNNLHLNLSFPKLYFSIAVSKNSNSLSVNFSNFKTSEQHTPLALNWC